MTERPLEADTLGACLLIDALLQNGYIEDPAFTVDAAGVREHLRALGAQEPAREALVTTALGLMEVGAKKPFPPSVRADVATLLRTVEIEWPS